MHYRSLTILICLLSGCAQSPSEVLIFQYDGAVVPNNGSMGGQMGGPSGGDACGVGDVRCANGFEEVCGNNGLWTLTNSRGDCEVDACAEATRTRSYIGCEYWPVDLDNAVEIHRDKPMAGRCTQAEYQVRNDLTVCVGRADIAGLCDVGGTCPPNYACRQEPACVLDAQGSPFSIVVSNPSDTEAATITLTDPSGHSHSESLAPNAMAKLFPGQLGFADRSIDHTSQTPRAYKLVADQPIVAYQFNPLDNVGVFSNDGSLLIPQHAYDTIYYVMTLPTLERRPRKNDYNGYVSIVGTSPGNTTVRVNPTSHVRAGISIGRLQAGQPVEFTLAQGDVLNLEAEANGDLTGTKIEAVDESTTFGVFVGHEATVLSDRPPRAGLCCADHVEEQLFPASTWGTQFVIARTEPRADRTRGGGSAPDMLRILAQKDSTEITFDPPVLGMCPVLSTGEFCDVFINGDTTISASQPVLVGHLLISTDGQLGDPALAFVAPFEQFRDAYTFLVPDEYAQQYISVSAWGQRDIRVDGVDKSNELTPITGNWFGGRIPVEPGQHVLTCPDKCGLIVYGYSQAVSYLFAGGLDLAAITLP